MKHALLALSLVALLSACASGPQVQTAPGAAAPAPAPAAKAPPLAAEQKWLSEWFSGTPVEIAAQDDGALRVAVPLKHSFDSGQSRVKPALGAVLDKVATSLKRQANAKVEVAVPADGAATASDRSGSVRDYLVAKGVKPNRISRQSTRVEGVELKLVPGPTAIERLDDSTLSGSGTRAPVMQPRR